MRIRPTRPRLFVAATAVLAILALVLGIVLPPDRSNVGAAGIAAGPPLLLISEYADEVSTLWLIDPEAPGQRRPFLSVPHAMGWELEGALRPDGGALAFLTLPPGRSDPQTQAVFFLSLGQEPQPLADGLDLRGGVVWAADGESVLLRRTTVAPDGRRTFSLIELTVATGRETVHLVRSDVQALHPVGRPLGGPPYVALVGGPAGGSVLVAAGAGAASDKALLLSNGVTRDWRLSPDGTVLAFTEQRGLDLQVRVLALTDAGRGDALRSATAAIEQARSDSGSRGTASPVWHPDGSLSLGAFGAQGGSPALRVAALEEGTTAAVSSIDLGAAAGFALPLAWSPDGRYLAARLFEGRGPGAVGEDTVAIVGAGGSPREIAGRFISVLGWWSGGG